MPRDEEPSLIGGKHNRYDFADVLRRLAEVNDHGAGRRRHERELAPDVETGIGHRDVGLGEELLKRFLADGLHTELWLTTWRLTGRRLGM